MNRLFGAISESRKAEVIRDLDQASAIGRDYVLLVLLSCVIATFGLILNSGPIIIGAMLIAPLMSSILAFALALVRGDLGRLWRALLTLLAGILLATALSTALGRLASAGEFNFLEELPAEILSRTRPTLFDLAVAVAGGAAAAYALAQPHLSATLPGVAIATALMPPVCVIGIGLSQGRGDIAGGALLLFLANFVAIVFASSVIFAGVGFGPLALAQRRGVVSRALLFSSTLLVLVTAPLGAFMIRIVGDAQENEAIRTILVNEMQPGAARESWSFDEPVPVLVLYNLDRSWSPADWQAVIAAVERLQAALTLAGHLVTPVPVRQDVAAALKDYDPTDNVVFNGCEGLEGFPDRYDLVPPVLESLGFAYTGADARSLALSSDKRQMRAVLQANGVTVPRGRVFTSPGVDGWNLYPAIVKPVAMHCSEGITREAVVTSPAELRERVIYVLDTFRQPALVEEFIDGREFHVAVWGDGRPAALPLAEMDFSAFSDIRDRLCTYAAKWEPESLAYRLIETLCPAPVDATLRARIEAAAVASFRALGCRDYGRMDIRVRDDVVHVLDVNPNSDISEDGSFALATEVAGFSYPRMVSRIVQWAAVRRRRVPR